MFTKQHYKKIAKILQPVFWDGDSLGELADMFERDNPRFDKNRFLLACGADKNLLNKGILTSGMAGTRRCARLQRNPVGSIDS